MNLSERFRIPVFAARFCFGRTVALAALFCCALCAAPSIANAQDKKKDDVSAAPLVTIDHPVAAVTALAFSQDGKKLALGTYGQVVVYDTATWKQTVVCRQIVDAARSLAFSPDGNSLAIGCGLPGMNGIALVWDLNPASKPHAYPPQKDVVESVAYSKDGKSLLYGSDDNRACYLAALPTDKGTNLDEHNGRVQAVAFSPKNGYVFITGAADRIVKVWDEKSVHTIANFDQSEGAVTGLAFINDNQFVGSSLDGKLYWWGVYFDEKKKVYGGYHFRTTQAHDGGVFALGISENRNRVISSGADDHIRIWKNDGGQERDFDTCKLPAYAVALSPDGKLAAAGGREGAVYLWDVDGNKFIDALIPPALPLPPTPKPTSALKTATKTKSVPAKSLAKKNGIDSGIKSGKKKAN